MTTDLGIPVFASITRRTDGLPEQIMPGFGAHLDPKIALLRAVTEMNQMLSSPLLVPREQGADKEPMDPDTAHWLDTATAAMPAPAASASSRCPSTRRRRSSGRRSGR